jgi:RNA polymerase sigma-70 factor, ECF subfamily
MASQRSERREEFERAVMPHAHALHSVAIRLTRRSDDAEDLVQDTLLRAYRFFDSYEPGTNIRAWLFKVMRNLFINSYRKDKREPEAVDFGGVEETLEVLLQRESADKPGTSNPEQILLDGTLDEEVERALADLPSEYRMVLLLSATEGLSYKEIAAVLSCPIGTVMSRLHRARRLMQASLMEYARQRGLVETLPPRGGNVVRLDSARESRRG